MLWLEKVWARKGFGLKKKNFGSKKLGDGGDFIGDCGGVIGDGGNLLGDGGYHFSDGGELISDGGDLLADGGDLLGEGDGGHHNVISTLCKGSEALTEWKTQKSVTGAQRLSCGAQRFSRTDRGRC